MQAHSSLRYGLNAVEKCLSGLSNRAPWSFLEDARIEVRLCQKGVFLPTETQIQARRNQGLERLQHHNNYQWLFLSTSKKCSKEKA